MISNKVSLIYQSELFINMSILRKEISGLSGLGSSLYEPLITLQTDVFDLLNLSFVPFSRIQQLAHYSHQDEYDDNRMQLEEKKKQQQNSDQKKDHCQDDPKRIISGILMLDW